MWFSAISFSHPLVLAGLAAAALPWIIHLILRTRPRTVLFPALVLLEPALRAGRRASRLRNLWLLLIRTLLVAVAAVLLSGPSCRREDSPLAFDGPITRAFVIDSSLSMSYAADGGILRDAALRRARELVQACRSAAAGSRFGLLFSDQTASEMDLTANIDELDALMTEYAAEANARPLGACIRAAADALRAATDSQPGLVVITDNAVHAWRDVEQGILGGINGVQVRIENVSPPNPSNLSIQSPADLDRNRRTGARTSLYVDMRAQGTAAECRVLALRGGDLLATSAAVALSPGGVRGVALTIPPLPAGPAGIRLVLEPDDRLSFDQSRHVALSVGAAPIVLIVSPGVAAGSEDVVVGSEDVATLIVENLLSPASLDEAQRWVDVSRVTATNLPSAIDERPALIVVISDADISPASSNALLEAVKAGAHLLLLPGSDDQPADWPHLREQLAAAQPRLVDTGFTRLRWEPSSPLADGDVGLEDITQCTIRRRLAVSGLRSGTVVHARYTDRSAALVSRKLGRGALWLLTTSPDPAWSELGTRAAGLITLLHRLLRAGQGPTTCAANFVVDEQSRRPFPALAGISMARISLADDPSWRPMWIPLEDGAPAQPWPTARPGLYTLAGSDGRTVAAYAVNWPAEESDLTPMARDQIAARLGVESVSVGDRARGIARQDRGWLRAGWAERLSPEQIVGGALLILFFLELSLANRKRE